MTGPAAVVSIVRVHDVVEMMYVVNIATALKDDLS